MDIQFPAGQPAYSGDTLTVTFTALVDGRAVECAISAEALEDHFGAPCARERELLTAFEQNRPSIEDAAREVILQLDGCPILLRSGYFRFLEQ